MVRLSVGMTGTQPLQRGKSRELGAAGVVSLLKCLGFFKTAICICNASLGWDEGRVVTEQHPLNSPEAFA